MVEERDDRRVPAASPVYDRAVLRLQAGADRSQRRSSGVLIFIIFNASFQAYLKQQYIFSVCKTRCLVD